MSEMQQNLPKAVNEKVRADADKIEERRKDNWEAANKALYSLMVGHAAGLVGCLTLLKDYDATSPGHLKGLGAFIWLFGLGNEVDGALRLHGIGLRPRQQAGRGIKPEDLPGLSRIERQIEAGPDADVEHAAFHRARNARAVRTQHCVAHRQIDQCRNDPFPVEAHRRVPVPVRSAPGKPRVRS